jgi:hypothetical protein
MVDLVWGDGRGEDKTSFGLGLILLDFGCFMSLVLLDFGCFIAMVVSCYCIVV